MKLKEIEVPIFTEEYKVVVVLGELKDIAKYVAKNVEGWDYQGALRHCEGSRGDAWNRLRGTFCLHPLITINMENVESDEILATLPHEASHAMTYIMDFLGIKDPEDEFKAHGISAIMRHCLKRINKWMKNG